MRMQRASLMQALDAFLGRNATESVMREIRLTMSRLREAHPHRPRTIGVRYELETLVRQLSRTPRHRS